MTRETTQPSLLSRVRDNGDQAAWREFDAKYRDLILRYCRRKGLQPHDAEDIRQVVMLSLAKQLRTFQYEPGKGRFRDYLGVSVRHAIHRFFRSHRNDAHRLGTHDAAGLTVDDDEGRLWETEWMRHHHRRAMETVRTTVDAKSVDVFERLLAGETPAEIGSALSMTSDAVRKVKQRMRERLRDLVARQIHEEEGFDLETER